MTLSGTSAGMYIRRHCDWTRLNVFILDVSNVGDPEPQQAQKCSISDPIRMIDFNCPHQPQILEELHDSSAKMVSGGVSSQTVEFGSIGSKDERVR